MTQPMIATGLRSLAVQMLAVVPPWAGSGFPQGRLNDLSGNLCDANGLNRDRIAAISLYAQEHSQGMPGKKANLYRPMDTALRSHTADGGQHYGR